MNLDLVRVTNSVKWSFKCLPTPLFPRPVRIVVLNQRVADGLLLHQGAVGHVILLATGSGGHIGVVVIVLQIKKFVYVSSVERMTVDIEAEGNDQ